MTFFNQEQTEPCTPGSADVFRRAPGSKPPGLRGPHSHCPSYSALGSVSQTRGGRGSPHNLLVSGACAGWGSMIPWREIHCWPQVTGRWNLRKDLVPFPLPTQTLLSAGGSTELPIVGTRPLSRHHRWGRPSPAPPGTRGCLTHCALCELPTHTCPCCWGASRLICESGHTHVPLHGLPLSPLSVLRLCCHQSQ